MRRKMHAPARWCWSGHPAGNRRGLLHPTHELRLVESFFPDIEIARVLIFAGPGWQRIERRAAKERYLHVMREDVKRQKPALALDAIERRVPFHSLLHLRHCADNERVEALSHRAFP